MRDSSRALPDPPRPARWPVFVIAILGPLFGAAYALWLGQDKNYDQLNYHFEAVYEFLNNRLGIDAAPSGLIHSYLNPLPYVPFYEMARAWRPQFVILALGAWHGVNFALAYALAYLLAPAHAPARRAVLAVLAAVVSTAGAMTLSEIGTSMSDLELSPLILLAVLLLVGSARRGRTASAFVFPALASALIGLAIGVKLTHAIYGIGLAVACAIGWRTFSERLLSLLVCGLAGVLGVAVSGGFWFLTLWRRFQSPLFPYYDAIFHSPAIDPTSDLHGQSFYDTRFLPTSLSDALLLPFRWMAKGQSTSELTFRDIRFALFFVILLAGIAALIWRRLRAGATAGDVAASQRAAEARLLVFFLAAYIAWLDDFGIQRYLIVLELLLGPALLVTLGWLLPRRLLPYVLAALAAAAALTVVPPNWGRVKHHRAAWFDLKLPPALQRPALVLAPYTTSYAAPFLPPESVVVGFTVASPLRPGGGGFINQKVAAALARDPALPAVLLAAEPIAEDSRRMLGAFGFNFEGPCQLVPNAAAFLAACPLKRGTPVARPAPTLRAGETLAFGATAEGVAALLSGWNVDSGWGWVGTDYQPKLLLAVDSSLAGAPVKLSVSLVGPEEFRAGDALTLRAGDRTLAVWPKETLGTGRPLIACIPADVFASAQPAVLVFGYRRLAPGGGSVRGSMGIVSLNAERGDCEASTSNPVDRQ